MITLDDYAPIVGEEVVGQLHRLAEHLQGRRFVHINSTAVGGGVAEILSWAVPLMNQLGLQTTWEVIMGDPAFFEVTKAFHNGLQGFKVNLNSRHAGALPAGQPGERPAFFLGGRRGAGA